MSHYMGLSRRSGIDRRTWNTGPNTDRRGVERRRDGTDTYVVVVGDVGVDRMGLVAAFFVLCLVAIAFMRILAGM